jgi:hypothetical protein
LFLLVNTIFAYICEKNIPNLFLDRLFRPHSSFFYVLRY